MDKLKSCGLLLLPVIAWNVMMMPLLPRAFAQEEFWREIPEPHALAENGLRMLVFSLPFLMPLQLRGKTAWRGLALYVSGLVSYFASWMALILAPQSAWSVHAIGFLAPAFTPLLWLTGLALVGQHLFWGGWYRPWMYISATFLFVIAHVCHAWLVYSRNY